MRPYQNPIIPTMTDGTTSDPHVTRYGEFYYHCYYRTGGVYVAKAERLCDLAAAEAVCVYPTPTTGIDSAWFAPELHRLDGTWYIYGAPLLTEKDVSSHSMHTMSVLEGTSSDPQGAFVNRGVIKGLKGVWSIDGSILELEGERFFLWTNCRTLYLTRMASPTELVGEHIPLARPTLPFETKEGLINEGPAVLHRNGKTYVVFSANDSRCDDYCLGVLRFLGGDVTDPANWEKHPVAVFEKTAEVFGPGHCSFTTVTEDGREVDYVVYHANLTSGSGWNGRSVWAQPFAWDENDFPVFGTPQKQIH